MSKKDDNAVSPETVARLEANESKATPGNGMGNLLHAIDEHVAPAIAELETERDGLVARVLELNGKIVRLRTHQLVGGEESVASA